MKLGVLLPVAALPNGKFKDGYKFVDWLAKNSYQYWQILPLNPRDSFGSPYNTFDPFAVDGGYGTEKQWFDLKKYANKNGVKIIGDLPFFVAKDSIEVKKYPQYFNFDFVSGVPADMYSRHGQLWRQPQYNWEELERDGFKLFINRFEKMMKLYDLIRLDHFRGYEAVWMVPNGKSTRFGHWHKVPGEKLFNMAKIRLGELPFIAEDLGHITKDVERLRRRFGFLGNRVIQYQTTAEEDVVYYTSTHDSKTFKGFYKSKSKEMMEKFLKLPAKIKIIPMWDILGLDNKARYNVPGKKKGNWKWKLQTHIF